MALKVRYVENVLQIVDPVVAYLGQATGSGDVFETQHLIVPTAGMRAWLAPQVAARLGATDGSHDGVMANIRVGYLGMLNTLLRDGVEDESDAWSIERVTMALLRVLRDRDPDKDPFIAKHGGHLRAARALADRFDRYAARRPQLIRRWERARAMNEEVGNDNANEEWQYGLWRRVREIIGVPSWPARTEELCARLRAGTAIPGLPRRLMIAGIEAVSVANLEIIAALGEVIDVDVIIVHPSPWLRDRWAALAGSIKPSNGLAPSRNPESSGEYVIPGCDILVNTWLRGSYETQVLLASQGIATVPAARPDPAPGAQSLLGRMQQAIAAPDKVEKASLADRDRSVQIHRAHNLARQVEILRDALLHAFGEHKDLSPDEIVVLCADIESAAPLLRAVFDQPMRLADGRAVSIPFVVADRSLRDVSDGAKLLEDVLSLVGSRFDVDSVMKVATNDLVMRNLRLDQDDVEVWQRHISTTRVRWGLDPAHRTSTGFEVGSITAHSWQQMLDRALLGALLPDADVPRREMGEVVPLVQVDTADVDSLTGLASVLGLLARLERFSRELRPVGTWCLELEDLLVGLCGESCTDIDDVLAVIQSFRDATIGHGPTGSSEVLETVDFAEFADLLLQKVSGVPGHQPLRTGAVTATSFVPLRSVPFRVVCILGLDDGTLSVGEAEGDDLIAMDPVMGDPDPRVDTRRVILDAVCAAGDSLVITCNGRSIRNNGPVPLVTPLAELVDFCGRLGAVVPDDPDKPSQIEHIHPRHATGRSNFVERGGPVDGRVWSHDSAALNAARSMFGGTAGVPRRIVAGEPLAEVPLRNLETMLIDPLDYYLRESLHIYSDFEDDPEKGATLPVEIDKYGLARLAEQLVKAGNGDGSPSVLADWGAAAEASDVLPVGQFGLRALTEAQNVAEAVAGRATQFGVPFPEPDPMEFKVHGDGGTVIDCQVPRVIEGDGDGGFVYSVLYHDSSRKELRRLALRLLVLRAAGKRVSRAVLVQRDATQKMQMAHIIVLDEGIDQQEALQRVSRLAQAEALARVTPCPLFDETGQAVAAAGTFDDDGAVDKFDDCLEGNTYGNSREFVVFGASPEFGHVFPAGETALLDFYVVHGGTCTAVEDGGKSDATQKWVVR